MQPFQVPLRAQSMSSTRSAPALLPGILVGLVAASIGALYTVFARYGIERGLQSSDLTFIRFATAGLLTAPFLAWHLRRDAAALLARWRSWLAIALLAGPLFGLLMFSAFAFAPASHAAVFPFSAMSVMGTLLAARVLGDRVTRRKAVGIGIVLTGLVVLSGLDASSFTARALVGDGLFIAAGTLWAGFGIVLRKNKLDPLLATSVISLFALVLYVPLYLVITGGARLLAADTGLLAVQVLVQGVIAGVGTLYTYAKMVTLLGPARAAVFPALAPGLAALMAWPVLGHVPSGPEAVGLGLAIFGLLASVTGTASHQPRRQP
ncbi:MAG: DMT family transporter [Comamonadaceae bacterium]|nr:MAG: DMT family transporter [Comamonadaceae bacterium]